MIRRNEVDLPDISERRRPHKRRVRFQTRNRHRAASIKPRDIFDIAAAGKQHKDSLIKELRSYRDQVMQALSTLDRLNADFVNGAIAELAIKDRYKQIAKVAIQRSKEILRAV